MTKGSDVPKRIFWLGMHKVLRTTELPQLRDMGYEVFSPAYISDVYDQSADRAIDLDQPTTLPDDVFAELLAHNFFYSSIPSRIGDYLNQYFDCVIVTINADWLRSIVDVFKKRIIYRIYGQPYSLSEYIMKSGTWEKLMVHGDFHIVPFAAETTEFERPWFRDLCAGVVPYQIPDDVFDFTGTWGGASHNGTIATSIPNVENAYYSSEYRRFNSAFPHRVFRIYGPQRSTPDDTRFVGALRRQDFLGRLRDSAGFFYNFRDPVCYLAPIESMQIGVPVLFAPGSLLHRFYPDKTPGLIRNQIDAERKIKLLLNSDATFAAEVIESQEPVRQRYDREIVRPKFERLFRALIDREPAHAPCLVFDHRSIPVRSPLAPQSGAGSDTVALLMHIDGLVGYAGGKPSAFEGIPRVIEAVVSALQATTDLRCAITCTETSVSVMYDFFRDYVASGRVELIPIPATAINEEVIQSIGKMIVVNHINGREDIKSVLVPHYYLFPESLFLKKRITLYLPDYFPYLMPEAIFDISREKDIENKEVGVAIAKKAANILTNSDFTRSYLPAAGFVRPSEADKVIVAPLPLLGERGVEQLSRDRETQLKAEIGGRPYLFYPTAVRPNKNIGFFLRVLAEMRVKNPDMIAVLTGDLRSVPGVQEICDDLGLEQHIVFMRRVGDDVLAWLYRHAVALCLTPSVEGNFPPQVLEALAYGCPVVSTRLPTITEVLPDGFEMLLLCNERDQADFTRKIDIAMEQRDQTLLRQAAVMGFMRERNSIAVFAGKVAASLGYGDALSREIEQCASA